MASNQGDKPFDIDKAELFAQLVREEMHPHGHPEQREMVIFRSPHADRTFSNGYFLIGFDEKLIGSFSIAFLGNWHQGDQRRAIDFAWEIREDVDLTDFIKYAKAQGLRVRMGTLAEWEALSDRSWKQTRLYRFWQIIKARMADPTIKALIFVRKQDGELGFYTINLADQTGGMTVVNDAGKEIRGPHPLPALSRGNGEPDAELLAEMNWKMLSAFAQHLKEKGYDLRFEDWREPD